MINCHSLDLAKTVLILSLMLDSESQTNKRVNLIEKNSQ
jgi:hypothetical protein